MTPLSHLCTDDLSDRVVALTDGPPIMLRRVRRDVARLAAWLAMQPGHNWVLASEHPYDFLVSLLAVWHAGKQVTVPASLQPGAVREATAQADGLLDGLGTWQSSTDTATDMDAVLRPFNAERSLLDLFTSGSSGAPKRIRKSAAQLEREIVVLESCWGGRREPVFATVPHHHIYGLLFRLLWPLASGRPFDTLMCTAPEFLLARLDAHGPGQVVSSPSQLNRMPDLIDLQVLQGKATRFYSSGGPLNPTAAGCFQRILGTAPVEIFGSTETGGVAWREQRDGDDSWTPLPGVQIARSAAGALVLCSPFIDDDAPYETNDAATLLDDGRFRIHGRLDRIVKIEEKRLSLSELEARLVEHPWVREAAAIVLSEGRQIVATVVALNDDGQLALEQLGRAALGKRLRTHLRQWFDAVLLPRRWRYPDVLPYNERGKLAADDLAAMFETTETQRE